MRTNTGKMIVQPGNRISWTFKSSSKIPHRGLHRGMALLPLYCICCCQLDFALLSPLKIHLGQQLGVQSPIPRSLPIVQICRNIYWWRTPPLEPPSSRNDNPLTVPPPSPTPHPSPSPMRLVPHPSMPTLVPSGESASLN